ncbi:hypothetical protein PORY_001915 [Pneumocystis oryctolagi]|uniref:Uncharacterized protein n=1 Tax=Pneumocystis oryctolagi TaxID=42067 RepID=A0ACB7CBT1_9ASCO|nr:hypothetical protein PORY_001915 [Pneumocystis oryctolagi]
MSPQFWHRNFQRSFSILRIQRTFKEEFNVMNIKKKTFYLRFYRFFKSTYHHQEKTIFPNISNSEIRNNYLCLMKCVMQPVVIVTTCDLKTNGLGRAITISSFASICINPIPIVSFSIKFPSRMISLLQKSKKFAIHILKSHHDQIKLAQNYAQSNFLPSKNMSNILENHCRISLNGLPILTGTLGILYCSTKKTIKIGDHKVWFATVEHVENQDTSYQMPLKFQQTVVLSDGSTFTISTTSPKPIIWITKDQRNHPLWNPEKKRLIDESDNEGRLKKFKQRFGTNYDLT